MKLKVLSSFAAAYGEAFHRIEALAAIDGRMKVLDMNLEAVREAVRVADRGAIDLYRSTLAVDYDPKKR